MLINSISVQSPAIVVGDIMKSITVYELEGDKIQEKCKDHNSVWTSTTVSIDSNSYFVADHDGNLFALSRNIAPLNDEEKFSLR